MGQSNSDLLTCSAHAERSALKRQKPVVVWLTGLSGAGKSTIAGHLERSLLQRGRHTMLLDGDALRCGLNSDLAYSDADRVENIRRTAEVAKLMAEAGLIVICSLISPFRADRLAARRLLPEGDFLEVFIDTPIEECIRRDPKGLYARALAGLIPHFTGIASPYEPPEAPDLHLRTLAHGVEELTGQIVAELQRRGAFGA